MAIAILLIGLPGCGKSFLARQFCDHSQIGDGPISVINVQNRICGHTVKRT